jgi:hypothetical protein
MEDDISFFENVLKNGEGRLSKLTLSGQNYLIPK